MHWTEDQRRRVGAAVAARRDQLGITQAVAVERAGGGVSLPVWSILENGRQPSFKRRSLAAVCRALGWTTDSIDRILRGDEPEELQDMVRIQEWGEKLARAMPVDLERQDISEFQQLRQAARDLIATVGADGPHPVPGIEGSRLQLLATAKGVIAAVDDLEATLRAYSDAQFAMAADAGGKRSSKSPGQRVSRPQPDVADD